MQKSGSVKSTKSKRVLARVLAAEELVGISGGDDTTWTAGVPRKDFTQISAGDIAGDPPAD